MAEYKHMLTIRLVGETPLADYNPFLRLHAAEECLLVYENGIPTQGNVVRWSEEERENYRLIGMAVYSGRTFEGDIVYVHSNKELTPSSLQADVSRIESSDLGAIAGELTKEYEKIVYYRNIR